MAPYREYFRVLADPSAVDRWFLDEPTTNSGETLDARIFIAGTPYRGLPPIHVPVSTKGCPRAFNFAAFDMPVVTREVAAVIENHASDSVQLFPVTVSEYGEQFFVLNATQTIECVDDENSDVMKWTEADDRPDKVGQYRMITKLAIAPASVTQQNIFRLKGWEIALIVSADVREELIRIPNLGAVFQRVA